MEDSVYKLRVLWINASSSWGGAEISSLTMVRSLVDLGFDCRLCAPPGSYVDLRCQEYGIECPPIDIPTLKTNPITTLRSICRFIQSTRALCQSIRPDVIVGHGERTHVYLATLRLTGTLIPQLWCPVQHWQIFRVIYRLIGWVPQRFVVGSNSVRRFYSIPKTVVIPVPFELPVSLGSLNGRLNEKPMGTFVVGIFARLNRVKGIHVLIKAVARLRLENLPVHLLVFGERSSIDPRYADELEMMVEAGGLRECVTFRGFTSEVIDAMRQCDVIVSCSLPRFGGPESFGRTVVEAWVAGVPVIATAVGGPAESVEHGRNGILVPAEDPIALAQSIQLLIENRELASRIANGGRESLPKYDSHHVAKLFGDALADCVHKGFGDL